MKVCRRCGEHKELDEFYRHSRMKDGHLNICKVCECEDSRRQGKTEQRREYEKTRNQGGDRKKFLYENLKRWRRENPEKVAEQQRRYPERRRARRVVKRAIMSGRIKRMPCEVCGSELSEAYHDDYSRPLDVRWLCKLHHEIVHGRKV